MQRLFDVYMYFKLQNWWVCFHNKTYSLHLDRWSMYQNKFLILIVFPPHTTILQFALSLMQPFATLCDHHHHHHHCIMQCYTVSLEGLLQAYLDSTVHGAKMGPIWGRQDPGRPHVGPMKFAIWVPASTISTQSAPGPSLTYHWARLQPSSGEGISYVISSFNAKTFFCYG